MLTNVVPDHLEVPKRPNALKLMYVEVRNDVEIGTENVVEFWTTPRSFPRGPKEPQRSPTWTP